MHWVLEQLILFSLIHLRRLVARVWVLLKTVKFRVSIFPLLVGFEVGRGRLDIGHLKELIVDDDAVGFFPAGMLLVLLFYFTLFDLLFGHL
jgi:hypothetical protein